MDNILCTTSGGSGFVNTYANAASRPSGYTGYSGNGYARIVVLK